VSSTRNRRKIKVQWQRWSLNKLSIIVLVPRSNLSQCSLN
jgi:hypothetical protein